MGGIGGKLNNNWNPNALIGNGQVDVPALSIGQGLKKDLPETFEEAISLYGPLELTHIIPVEVPAEGNLVDVYFITSLRLKPEVFFIGFEYGMPYFKEWVENVLVRDGQFSVLPYRIEIPTLSHVPVVNAGGEVMLVDESNLASPFIYVSELKEASKTVCEMS